MILLALAAAHAHESDPQPFLLEDTADLYSSAEMDTGWMPADGLLAVRFYVLSTGGATVEMEGESNVTWPEGLNLGFTPEPQSGWIGVISSLGVFVDLKFDIDIYSWESQVAAQSVEVKGESFFEPFAMLGGAQEQVQLLATGASDNLFEYYYDVLGGVASVGFYATMQPQSVVTFEGLAWEVEGQQATLADQTLNMPVPAGGAASYSASFLGAYESTLDLVFTPTFEVCITLLGCYDWSPMDLPLNLAGGRFEQYFPPLDLHFPLPVLQNDVQAHDFGAVEVGNLANLELPLGNLGELLLEGTTEIVGSSDFTVYPEYFLANEGSTDGLVVTYSPTAAGATEATLVIHSNDPLTPDLEIPLTGEGFLDESNTSGGDGDVNGKGDGEMVNSCGCAATPTGRPGSVALGALLLAGLVGWRRRRA